MASSAPRETDGLETAGAIPEGLLELIEGIRHPAFVSRPGGRIAAVNRVTIDLLGDSLIGLTIDQLIERFGCRLAGGRPAVLGDLPVRRALRGEIVAHGEQIELTLPDGSTYGALVTSTPIVVEGMVVAALSVWYDLLALAPDRAGHPSRNGGA